MSEQTELPEWNDLPESLRTELVGVADKYAEAYLGGDMAVNFYAKLRSALATPVSPDNAQLSVGKTQGIDPLKDPGSGGVSREDQPTEPATPDNAQVSLQDAGELIGRLTEQMTTAFRRLGGLPSLLRAPNGAKKIAEIAAREAAARIEADAAALAALRERFDANTDYSIDLQRIIEALCKSREIPEPKTTARHHYDMAVAAQSSFAAAKEREQMLERERDKSHEAYKIAFDRSLWRVGELKMPIGENSEGD